MREQPLAGLAEPTNSWIGRLNVLVHSTDDEKTTNCQLPRALRHDSFLTIPWIRRMLDYGACGRARKQPAPAAPDAAFKEVQGMRNGL